MAAATQFRDANNQEGNAFQFTASATWLTTFIKNYRISNRRVIRYVSKKKEIKSPEEISKSAIVSKFDTINFYQLRSRLYY